MAALVLQSIKSNFVNLYLHSLGIDGDLLLDGVVRGVDLGVDSVEKSPVGLDSCPLSKASFSSGTAEQTIKSYSLLHSQI